MDYVIFLNSPGGGVFLEGDPVVITCIFLESSIDFNFVLDSE